MTSLCDHPSFKFITGNWKKNMLLYSLPRLEKIFFTMNFSFYNLLILSSIKVSKSECIHVLIPKLNSISYQSCSKWMKYFIGFFLLLFISLFLWFILLFQIKSDCLRPFECCQQLINSKWQREGQNNHPTSQESWPRRDSGPQPVTCLESCMHLPRSLLVPSQSWQWTSDVLPWPWI